MPVAVKRRAGRAVKRRADRVARHAGYVEDALELTPSNDRPFLGTLAPLRPRRAGLLQIYHPDVILTLSEPTLTYKCELSRLSREK